MFKKILIILALLPFSGCASAMFLGPAISGVVQGVIIWVQGEAHKYYPYSIEVMHRSVKKAAEEMDLKITREDPLENDHYYMVLGDSDRFKVTITKIEKNITKVSIRINFLGDKPYAELFYGKIDEMVNKIYYKNGKPVKIYKQQRM